VPFGIATLTADKLVLVLAFYSIPAFLVNLYTGPTFGMTQSLAPLAMRASASALLLFIINIIGLVFGPTTIGIISDLLQGSMQMNDVDSLKYAMLACNLVYLVAFLSFALASKHLKEDLARSAEMNN
jgi:type III secretory pathway component EscS